MVDVDLLSQNSVQLTLLTFPPFNPFLLVSPRGKKGGGKRGPQLVPIFSLVMHVARIITGKKRERVKRERERREKMKRGRKSVEENYSFFPLPSS